MIFFTANLPADRQGRKNTKDLLPSPSGEGLGVRCLSFKSITKVIKKGSPV